MNRQSSRGAILRAKHLAIIAAPAIALSGCANDIHIPEPVRVASQDQAGTLLVSPTMVVPWADINGSLKPGFALTGDQAAAQVLPVTETINQQILSAVGFSLAAGLPTSSHGGASSLTTSHNSTTNLLPDGSTTTTATDSGGNTSTTTVTKAPGTAPDYPTGIPANGALPGAEGTAPAIGLDPVLRYKAANNLFQEVQLLNQEVSNATNRDCYVPFVVKLKLAVINYRPRLAYSVHSSIAFDFEGPNRSGDMSVQTLDPACSADLNRQPAVVPFLVADDVQVAVRSRAAEAATQIASALSFMVHGIGAKAQFNAVRQSLTAISNHDLSSSLTIGQSAENVITAVINPANVASGDGSLVSQTYDVAVLLLVPRYYFGGRLAPSPATLGVRSFTQYRDAKSGRVLPERSGATLIDESSLALANYMSPQQRRAWAKAGTDAKLDYINTLVSAVTRNDRAAFKEKLAGSACGKDYPCVDADHVDALWPSIAALKDLGANKVVDFQAPLPAPIHFPSQQIVLTDDGTHPVQAVLAGVDGVSSSHLGATLNVTPFDLSGDKGKQGTPVTLAASALKLDTDAHTLTLTFPSLKTLGVTCLAAPSDAVAVPARATKRNPVTGRAVPAPQRPVTCPPRLPGWGTAERPNNIELQVIGCDPGRQLCPDVTESRFAPNAEESTSLDSDARAKIQEALAVRLALMSQQADAAIQALRTMDDDEATPDQRRTATEKIWDQIQAERGQLDQAKKDGQDLSSKAYWAQRLQPHMIGVSLLTTAKSTTPSKLVLGDAGKTIVSKDGTGGFLEVVTNIPSGHTAGAVVSGAAVVTAIDSAGKPLNLTKNGYVLPVDGSYQFTLMNLTPGARIKAQITDYAGDTANGDVQTSEYVVVAAPLSGKPPTQ